MKHFIMRYPGDPPADIYEMTREESLAECPRQPIVISNPVTGEVYETIPMGADEIHCDLCSCDPSDVVDLDNIAQSGLIYLCRQGRSERAYCRQCFGMCWAPYCKEMLNLRDWCGPDDGKRS